MVRAGLGRWPGPGNQGVGAETGFVNAYTHVVETFLAVHRKIPRQAVKDRIADLIATFESRTKLSRHGVACERYWSNWSSWQGRGKGFVGYGPEVEIIYLLLDAYDAIPNSLHDPPERTQERLAC